MYIDFRLCSKNFNFDIYFSFYFHFRIFIVRKFIILNFNINFFSLCYDSFYFYLRQRSWGGIVFTPVCLFVCLFVNNFLTTVLVVEWWNFQGLIATLRSESDSFLKGLGQSRSKGQIHLIGYNFPSNCHRDFKLGSYFSLWKAAPNMTLTLTFEFDLEKFTQVKIFKASIKEN